MDPKSDYSPAFLKAIAFILPHEEEFARGHWGDENFVIAENVPGDRGGVTKWGLDTRSHPGVDVAKLNRDQAIGLYHYEWKCRNMDSLPAKLAIACFDVFVNGGLAVKWLQTAINKVGFSAAQIHFKLPIPVDGGLGPVTIAASWACDQMRVVWYFLDERDQRFRMLAAASASAQEFLDGWEKRDADLRQYLSA